MVEFRELNPHDPLPEGRFIAVMRRFEEDDPRRVMVETIQASGHGEQRTSRPQHPDGRLMNFQEAIAAARALAAERGLPLVCAVDRTEGPRERDILANGGDHSIHTDDTDDMDLEDGEHGPDMRDIGRR